jgi:hypothetical protein
MIEYFFIYFKFPTDVLALLSTDASKDSWHSLLLLATSYRISGISVVYRTLRNVKDFTGICSLHSIIIGF